MKKFIKSSYFAIIMAFIYIPIAVMILFSFNSGSTTFSWIGFSSKWYTEFFQNSPFIKSIVTSLFVAIVSTLISLVIGVAAAIGLSRTKALTQKSWLGIANIPLINADVVTAVSLMIVFLLSGVKFGLATLLMAHVSFNVPYVLITVMPRLRKVDQSLVEAGLDLGAKSHQVLFRVILPILKPAIVAAAAIAFAMSFDDFIISYFTGGSQTNVSTFIYTAKKIRPYIFAFGAMMVGVIVLGVVGWNAISIYRQQKALKVEKIKLGLYKSRELSKLKKARARLEMLKAQEVRQTYSWNPYLWLKYWTLKLQIKIVGAKNYDKKISRLEWKRYKLKSKISQEKRYYTRRLTAQKRLKKLNQQFQNASDVKKAAKLTLQIEKVQIRLEFLNEEIEWIENRDQLAAVRLKKIKKEIRELKLDWAKETAPSKKTNNWYQKKLQALEATKIEVEEGKNNYKLRMIVERLKEIQALKDDQILTLTQRLENIQAQVFFLKPWTATIDAKLLTTSDEVQLATLLITKQAVNTKFQTKLTRAISFKTEQIAQLEAKIQREKLKVAPVVNDEDDVVHTKGFFARSWKIIAVSILGIAAFSGLTVAYVLNNVYDLVIGNWGEYIDPAMIGEFEKLYGVKVNYQEYDSNETLYNKLYTFDYDVMVPSDYMVQRLAQEGQLMEIDWSQVNIDTSTWPTPPNILNQNDAETEAEKLHLNEALVNSLQAATFEVESEEKNLLNYLVPYFCGDLVIVVNPTQANKQFLTNLAIQFDEVTGQIVQSELSWDLLWQAVGAGKKVALNSDPKNLFALAGEKKYQKVNLDKKSEVDEVKEDVKKLVLPANVSLQGDELMTTVGLGDFDFALMYSGDALYANQVYNHEDDDDDNNDGDTVFLFGRPNFQHGNGHYETTNVFSDDLVISKKTAHADLAYKFINFVLERSAEISIYVGTPSPVQEAIDELTGPGGYYEKYKLLYESALGDPNYQLNGKEPLTFQYHPGTDDYLIDQFNNIVAGKIG